MSKRIQIGMALFLLIAAIATLVLVVLEYRRDSATSQRLYTRSVKKHDIVEAARNALTALNDAETREQDYVLTGETVYSEAYAEDIRNWQDESGSLELVARNDPATPIVKEFSEAGTRTLNELALVVSLYEKSGRQAALDRIGKSAGIVYLDQARASFAKILEVDGPDPFTRQIVLKALSLAKRLTAGAALIFVISLIGGILLISGRRRLSDYAAASENKS